MAVALVGMAAGCCGPCSDPPDVHAHELTGSEDTGGDPIGMDPDPWGEAPGWFDLHVRNLAGASVELDGALDRVLDVAGREHEVRVGTTGDAGCREVPADRIALEPDASCRLYVTAIGDDELLPADPAMGSTITVRLAARVDGGEPQYVDETISLGAHELRAGVCGP